MALTDLSSTVRVAVRRASSQLRVEGGALSRQPEEPALSEVERMPTLLSMPLVTNNYGGGES
jgi:hypothetical protein